ncbi:allophanate hydrolase subunit 1 [Nocardioides sp. TRM66260-LWL]|uniref:5-oxoprolinase subunit B family protein n=1 Tax=Nocardioides sp. TRM66260-LWL TaxID=2874478 RepID=UPI001CC4200F|nr:carboxyltransferase domain-containing protein [Nocardioides sp. TRM66260-LWL]MBZ5733708.1 allophanate hydrolase subunit 1 [Nocardioides sp. TRM66260-LWL]
MTGRLVRCGPGALVVEVDGPATAAGLASRLRTRLPLLGVVPGAESVLVQAAHGSLPDDVAAVVAAALAEPADADPGSGRLVELPVHWDGPDLDDVAARWGTDASGVVARLEATELTSAFCGFAPGFAYLAGLPAELAVPRLAAPRPRVPAGSVALADAWCGVYPGASPGGWRLVGRTDVALWDLDADPPALLAPGTRVRLVPA